MKKRQESKKIQQVKMLPETHAVVKEAANQNGLEISEMYERAINDFIDIAKISPAPVEYLTSPKTGTNTTIWITPEAHKRVQERARDDHVSMNRVLFTAIKHFVNRFSMPNL